MKYNSHFLIDIMGYLHLVLLDKMSAAYSEDLWRKIVFHNFVYGHNPESIARQLIISRLTVLRILKLYRDTGNVYRSHIPIYLEGHAN